MSAIAVCVSVTLVHPTKAAEWNEMPFGRDSRVVPSNRNGERAVLGSESPVHSNATKLLLPLINIIPL